MRLSRRDYEHIAGCLLGGAVGDALGAPVEFMNLDQIRVRFGLQGIQSYTPAYGRLGAITDDTQMTLFTMEGLIRTAMSALQTETADHIGVARNAYLRWLGTQGEFRPDVNSDIFDGWLYKQKGLHSRRAPGNSCLSALRYGDFFGSDPQGTIENPVNDSKGCGGVMRTAPAGIFGKEPFKLGCDLAAITHGHPTGYITAGFFAQLIACILDGLDLTDAMDQALDVVEQCGLPGKAETCEMISLAVEMASKCDDIPESVEKIGAGWIAEEALAISLFCAMKARDFAHGVRLAVNHGGDSDSTGSITGNILGALWGQSAISDEFLQSLELRDVIEEISRDWIECDFSQYYTDKYPDW